MMNYHKVFKGPTGQLWTVTFETSDGGQNYWPYVKGPSKRKISLMMSRDDVMNTLMSLQDLKQELKCGFEMFKEIVSGAMLMNMKKGHNHYASATM